MKQTPRGFRYDGRLDGGGFAFEGRLVLHDRYGPLRRYRLRRAQRAGDLRRIARLLLQSPDTYDLNEWDGPFLEAVVPILIEEAGLNPGETRRAP